MPYNITLTNGAPLLTLPDGAEDSVTTSLNLVGRNFPGYGLHLNENFIKLMEHFSSANAPSQPLIGQLWWDSTSKHLNVWQGTNWKVISSSMTGTTSPVAPVTGDFWWNTATSQFSVWSGTQWIAIGPLTLPGAAVTAIAANAVSDTSATTHYVGNITVNNKITGIFSSDTQAFTPAAPVGGITTIAPGLNLVAGLTTLSNIVSNGNVITSGNVYGNSAVFDSAVFSGNVAFTGHIEFPPAQNLTLTALTSNVVPAANLSYNLGSTTNWWNNIYGTAIHAQYADLAERFEADVAYEAGTVVELGGAAEITAAIDELSEDVFGVISTNAAFVMNSRAGDDLTHPPVAVQGRVPVKVTGKVKKGDRLVSAGNGIARAGKRSEISTWNVIGRSLENKDTLGLGVVEAVVKLNS